MSLFEKKPEIPRSQFRDILKKSDIKIGQGRQMSQRERAKIEKVDFSKRLGPSISHSEYKRTINKLTQEKMGEQDFTRKVKLGRELKFLKELEKGTDLPK